MPKSVVTEQKIVGKIFDRAAVLAAVNESFDDYEKAKKKDPDAEIQAVGFFFAYDAPEEERIEVEASVGGDKRLLLQIALNGILGH